MTAIPHPPILVVHARKSLSGSVLAYLDEAMRGEPLATWTHYATDCPSMRQRYVTINRQSYKCVWHS